MKMKQIMVSIVMVALLVLASCGGAKPSEDPVTIPSQDEDLGQEKAPVETPSIAPVEAPGLPVEPSPVVSPSLPAQAVDVGSVEDLSADVDLADFDGLENSLKDLERLS